MAAPCEEKSFDAQKRKVSNDESGDQPGIKQLKTLTEATGSHPGWTSLEPFTLVKVLKDDPQTKLVVVHAKAGKKKESTTTELPAGNGTEEADAIIVMEKTPFDTTESCIEQMLRGTDIAQVFNNDIYGTYNANPPKKANSK